MPARIKQSFVIALNILMAENDLTVDEAADKAIALINESRKELNAIINAIPNVLKALATKEG